MEESDIAPKNSFIEMTDIPKSKNEFQREGYTMDRDKMGICYIINNVDQEQPSKLKECYNAIILKYKSTRFSGRYYVTRPRKSSCSAGVWVRVHIYYHSL